MLQISYCRGRYQLSTICRVSCEDDADVDSELIWISIHYPSFWLKMEVKEIVYCFDIPTTTNIAQSSHLAQVRLAVAIVSFRTFFTRSLAIHFCVFTHVPSTKLFSYHL